jgi:hypothetical protein
VAVVVSIARGHDAWYPFKTIGAAEGSEISGERGAGYYLSAMEKGGEPAGTWIGRGAGGGPLRVNAMLARDLPSETSRVRMRRRMSGCGCWLRRGRSMRPRSE